MSGIIDAALTPAIHVPALQPHPPDLAWPKLI
jgi:hypothetical protein